MIPLPHPPTSHFLSHAADPVNHPKHGKEDSKNQPHVGGNTWAGGTGGRDTAGLGGKGGPYRLDKVGWREKEGGGRRGGEGWNGCGMPLIPFDVSEIVLMPPLVFVLVCHARAPAHA